jgi:carboxyl-terminal processing protease
MCQPISAQEAAEVSDDNPHQSGLEERQSLPLEELQMFADVFNQIRQGYVESVPDSKLFEMAVQGMLSGLDPHSVF